MKSFVAWHVRPTGQLLTTNIASCKRVGRPQGLNMPPICKRQSPLTRGDCHAHRCLAFLLPEYKKHLRVPKTKSGGGRDIHKLTKARNWDAGQKEDLKGSRVKPRSQETRFMWVGPATPRQRNSMLLFFLLPTGRNLNPKRGTRR